MSTGDWGLVVFVVVVVLNVNGLALDGMLFLLYGREGTVTTLAEAVPLVGASILLLQVVALLGLAIHFYVE